MQIRFRVLLAVLAGISAGPGPPRPERLTLEGLDKQRPSWSPDCKTILFARHESGGTGVWLYTMRADTPKSVQRLPARKEPEYNGVFSPDGGQVLFTAITLSGTQGNLDIAAIRADGSELKKLVGDSAASCRIKIGPHGHLMEKSLRLHQPMRETRRSTLPTPTDRI